MMTESGRNNLLRIAASARLALEKRADGSDSMFCKFPLGACGPAAELVGRVLAEQLGLESVYVCGADHPQLDTNQTHAWTETGPFIIDLTHDQFPNTGVTGWVLPASSGWHAQFREKDRRKGYCMPSGWPMYPHGAYRAILEHLEA
nr:hypothetical protein [uncultured Roseateles sp.]